MRTRGDARRAVGVTLLAFAASIAVLVGLGGRAGAGMAEGATTTLLQLSTTAPASSTTVAPTTTAPPTTEAPTTTPPKAAPTTSRQQTATTAARATAPTAAAAVPATAAPTTTTSNPLILPADPAAPASTPADASTAKGATNADKTGRIVAVVIAGLLVVAILLGLLTFRFWRNTRPLVVHAGDAAPDGGARGVGRDATRPLARR